MSIVFYTAEGLKGIPENTFVQLDGDSDRSVAIVGGSLIEQRLQELLKSKFPDTPNTMGIVRDRFRSSGALGTFSVATDIAYLFQLISEAAYDELVMIRKVRNRFAHDLAISSFDQEPICDWCSHLKLVDEILPPRKNLRPRGPVSTGEASVVWGGPTNFLRRPRDKFISTAAMFNDRLVKALSHSDKAL